MRVSTVAVRCYSLHGKVAVRQERKEDHLWRECLEPSNTSLWVGGLSPVESQLVSGLFTPLREGFSLAYL